MAVLRGAGDSTTPYYFLVLSVALDITFNPLFIFGAGPVPVGARRGWRPWSSRPNV
jgi:Na+-driven multidrug efflux pump